MKKNKLTALIMLLLCVTLLSACGNSAPADQAESNPPENIPSTEAPADSEEAPTLESLLGSDYVDYVTETITMQMGNRMDKTPDVKYFPITEKAPLSDYVTIDAETAFEVNEDGNIVFTFPAGAVTDEANGEQSFIIPKIPQ